MTRTTPRSFRGAPSPCVVPAGTGHGGDGPRPSAGPPGCSHDTWPGSGPGPPRGRGASSATDGGRDDDAEPEDHRADQDRQRNVLVLLDLLAERKRRDLRDEGEAHRENGDAEHRVGKRK